MSADLPAAFHAALASSGLWQLILAVLLAGLVRGFTGFGTTMIYMPVAALVLPPVWALITIVIFDVFGPLPNVPRAWREGQPRDVMWLGLGAMLALPLGVFLLTRTDPLVFRWGVSLLSLLLLGLLMTGWRWRGTAGRLLLLLSGSAGGFLGGLAGLSGPPVVLLYMSSRQPTAVIRANILLYLSLNDWLALAVIALGGLLDPVPVFIGLILTLPYLLANMAGAALFRPDRARAYRLLAYGLIAASALYNLPLAG